MLVKTHSRHAGENQHPVNNCFDWILAYARKTDNLNSLSLIVINQF
jgi:hypothetical protein